MHAAPRRWRRWSRPVRRAPDGTPVGAWVRPISACARESLRLVCVLFVFVPATLRTRWRRSLVHFQDRFLDQFCGQSKIATYGAGTLTRS